MNKKNVILVVIVILVIALAAVAAYIYTNNNNPIAEKTQVSNNQPVNTTVDVNDTNSTVIGDNSTRANDTTNITNNNTPYKVYNPQSDSYVPVIGEKYDTEVDRWYTYDDQGVRYYNTRIN